MNAVARAARVLADEAAWHDERRAACLTDGCPMVAQRHAERAAALRDAEQGLEREVEAEQRALRGAEWRPGDRE